MNGDSKQTKADFTAALDYMSVIDEDFTAALDYMSVIDEVYVWNTALSSDAVSALYNSTNGRFFETTLEQRESYGYDLSSRKTSSTDPLVTKS